MKIALISDVHANYPALLAVVKDAVKNNVDSFIFAGDFIFDLSYPNEVVELIRSLENSIVIKGNKEGYLKKLIKEDQSNWSYDQLGALYQTFRELKPENLTYLLELADNAKVKLPYHGSIYVTHYINNILGEQIKVNCSSSRYNKAISHKPFTHEQFLKYMSNVLDEKVVQDVVNQIDGNVIVLGHSHLQWYGYSGDKLIINPGSCGQPLDANMKAAYSILEDTQVGLKVIEKRVEYDIEQTIKHVQTTEIYKRGTVWCELVFLAMRTGKDYFGDFFTLAQSIAVEKNESGSLFSNETWKHAAEIFRLQR